MNRSISVHLLWDKVRQRINEKHWNHLFIFDADFTNWCQSSVQSNKMNIQNSKWSKKIIIISFSLSSRWTHSFTTLCIGLTFVHTDARFFLYRKKNAEKHFGSKVDVATRDIYSHTWMRQNKKKMKRNYVIRWNEKWRREKIQNNQKLMRLLKWSDFDSKLKAMKSSNIRYNWFHTLVDWLFGGYSFFINDRLCFNFNGKIENDAARDRLFVFFIAMKIISKLLDRDTDSTLKKRIFHHSLCGWFCRTGCDEWHMLRK